MSARIVDTTRGPTVTRYDLELDQGVKLSRLTNLAGDIALALGVVSVRIAPIPDKISTVGIEVPNKIISTVYLRDIIDSPRFASSKSKLSFAIGKDIAGSGGSRQHSKASAPTHCRHYRLGQIGVHELAYNKPSV